MIDASIQKKILGNTSPISTEYASRLFAPGRQSADGRTQAGEALAGEGRAGEAAAGGARAGEAAAQETAGGLQGGTGWQLGRRELGKRQLRILRTAAGGSFVCAG